MAALPILVFRRRYVTYCVPIVLVDAAERGWLESNGPRRGLWIALGAESLVTILLGILGIQPPVSGPAFLVEVTLVVMLTYLNLGHSGKRQDARPARRAAPDTAVPDRPREG